MQRTEINRAIESCFNEQTDVVSFEQVRKIVESKIERKISCSELIRSILTLNDFDFVTVIDQDCGKVLSLWDMRKINSAVPIEKTTVIPSDVVQQMPLHSSSSINSQ